MFDKLEDLLVRFEEVLNELGEPGVTDNQERFQKLMKEQSELQPIVDTYKEYKENKETIQDSLSMLEEEKDEEMREMLKEELSDAKKRVEELEKELKQKMEEITPIDRQVMEAAWKNWDGLCKPLRGLGWLEEALVQIAGIMRDDRPHPDKRAVVIMGADNGVVKEGVTQTDQSVTMQVLEK